MNIRIALTAIGVVAGTLSVPLCAHAQFTTPSPDPGQQPNQVYVAHAQVSYPWPTVSDQDCMADIVPDTATGWTDNSGAGGGKTFSIQVHQGEQLHKSGTLSGWVANDSDDTLYASDGVTVATTLSVDGFAGGRTYKAHSTIVVFGNTKDDGTGELPPDGFRGGYSGSSTMNDYQITVDIAPWTSATVYQGGKYDVIANGGGSSSGPGPENPNP